MPRFTRSDPSTHEFFNGRHRFEHWYRDNTVYFITSRVRNRLSAFASEEAKQIFWDRFNHYTSAHGFTPFVTTLLDNHYHTLGYLRRGSELGEMMRQIHGSVAKLVNDLLPTRHVPFWTDRENRDYFDGCIRNQQQCRRAYRYTLLQSVRHKIARDWHHYPHTHVSVELEIAVKRALELKAFLDDVPYQRYQGRQNRH